ncbi:hypothetical protein GJ496_003037 [Pomphorhynchus laevis]|nr:hypothetical protein GJ496_003037 [Pomphorhynchus laevis]
MSKLALHIIDSDEEELANTIGDVPLRWYDEYDHIGYDKHGEKIKKPKNSIRQMNEIDWFLDRMKTGGQWRLVYNSLTGEQIHLSEQDVKLAKSIHKCDNPVLSDIQDGDPYAPWPDLYSFNVLSTPVIGAPPSKSSFTPDIHEKRIVGRYLHAIKMGWLKLDKHPRLKLPNICTPASYDLWNSGDDNAKQHRSSYLAAPKLALPGHGESYNPLPEYAQENIDSVSCLRHVPAYENFTRERFERLLDLYLCPRTVNMKARFDPAILLPSLPSPRDLRPFPCTQTRNYNYNHHQLGSLNAIEFDNTGAYFACAGSKSYSLWNTSSERMVACIHTDVEALQLGWSLIMPLLAVALSDSIILCAAGRFNDIKITQKFLDSAASSSSSKKVSDETCCQWTRLNEVKLSLLLQPLVSIDTSSNGPCKQICWHRKGDYLSTIHKDNSILVHQISKFRSHLPFNLGKNNCKMNVSFHPSRALFFISSANSIRCYDLSLGQLMKTFKVGGGVYLSSPFSVHYTGDHLIVGCTDGSVRWFDLEMGTRPYKSLRTLHKTTVQSLSLHNKLPLLATASNDGKIVITHARVYTDLLKEPLIMPVKVFQLPRIRDDNCLIPRILMSFHPQYAWILSASSIDTVNEFTHIRLFTDVSK